MRSALKILLLILPLTLVAQSSSAARIQLKNRTEWEGLRIRIESAVAEGQITREQADQRYRQFRERKALIGNTKTDIVMADHFRKLGVSDISLIKNNLLDEGVPVDQLDASLGGMLRVIHAAKKEGVDFQINPRIESYFMDRLLFTRAQTQYIVNESVKIAKLNQ